MQKNPAHLEQVENGATPIFLLAAELGTGEQERWCRMWVCVTHRGGDAGHVLCWPIAVEKADKTVRLAWDQAHTTLSEQRVYSIHVFPPVHQKTTLSAAAGSV